MKIVKSFYFTDLVNISDDFKIINLFSTSRIQLIYIAQMALHFQARFRFGLSGVSRSVDLFLHSYTFNLAVQCQPSYYL